MHSLHIRRTFFLGLLLGVLVLTAFILMPYLITLSLAGTLAVVMQPILRTFLRWTRGRKGISAIITLLITCVLILIPLSFVITEVALQATDLYVRLSAGTNVLSFDILAQLEDHIRRYVPLPAIDLNQYAGQILQWLTFTLQSFFSSTVNTVVLMLLGGIAYFYMLRDGDRFIATLIDLSPLRDNADRRILARLENAVNSIIRGSFIIAIMQGLSTGIGLTIFGVPNAILWGSIGVIGGLIPTLGTGLVLIPAVLYLFLTDQMVSAVGLGIWALTAVGLIDNFLHPVLVGKRAHIHPIFILFAVLGGLSFFGPAGIILGPLTISLLFALLDIYREDVLNEVA